MADNKQGASVTFEAGLHKAEYEYFVALGAENEQLRDMGRIEEINGGTFFIRNGELKQLQPDYTPSASPVVAFSLTGLVDYMASNIDGMGLASKDALGQPFMLRIQSPRKVSLESPLNPKTGKRQTIVTCDAVIPETRFGRFLSPEDMKIMLLTVFQEDENRDLILKLVSHIKSEQSGEVADDGFSQIVTVRRGVATVGETTVKNPAMLTPIRTFHEVEQVESDFVLRFDEDGNIALFEADGSRWQIEAVRRIAEYLTGCTRELNVRVIA